MQSSLHNMRKLVNSLDDDTKYKFGQMFILKDDMRSYWIFELVRDDSPYSLEKIQSELRKLGAIR